MKKLPLDMEAIKTARENLERIAQENPHLIDPARAKWTKEDIAQMMLDPTKTSFTVEDAAEALNCHPQTIRRAIQKKELQAAKLGRVFAISKEDLEAYYQAKGGGKLFKNGN